MVPLDRKSWIIAILGASLIGGAVGGVAGLVASPALREPLGRLVGFVPRAGLPPGLIPPPQVVVQPGIAEDEQSVAVVERTQPAVVSIIISVDAARLRQARPFDPFFGIPLPEPEGLQQIGGGSGFFVSSDGLIVTNRHVVEDEDAQYTVVTRDGDQYPAKVLARDPVLDLAVLDIEGENFPTLTFGNSDEVKVGQTVIAIGNALDQFPNTVTKGVVSGLNRRITAGGAEEAVVLEEAIQTDAAINPGNSGGPLIDLHGNVVGVNSAVSYSGQLIGFALPANAAKRDVEQVKKHGRITRPFLGIRYVVLDESQIKARKLTVSHGVLIAAGEGSNEPAVIPGSPADAAGLKDGDVILQINGDSITEEHSLSALIGRYQPEDEVTLRVFRGGEEFETTAKLGEFKPTT